MSIQLGGQGWNYDAWVGPFYPLGTRAAEYLRVYARAFRTVEVDATFYAIPPSSTIKGWVGRVPPDFVFALKMPQEVTHERRLLRAEDVVKEFTDRARELGAHLGPILIQLSPDFSPAEHSAFEHFLPSLPRDLRFAVEFRHREWMRPVVMRLLKSHNVACALTDARWIPRRTMLQLAESPTADFAYIRWMGADRSIVDYSRVQLDRSRELEEWSRALKQLDAKLHDVFAFANNHYAGHAPATLREVQRQLGIAPVAVESLGEQMLLF